MGQSSGMAAVVIDAALLPDTGIAPSVELCAIETCCIAISIAIALPIQPRTGSRAIMRATSRWRMAQGYDKIEKIDISLT